MSAETTRPGRTVGDTVLDNYEASRLIIAVLVQRLGGSAMITQADIDASEGLVMSEQGRIEPEVSVTFTVLPRGKAS